MWPRLAFSLLVALAVVRAHPHHNDISDADRNAPIDAALYIHVALQVLAWGLLFPTGMVLGMTRCVDSPRPAALAHARSR